MSQRAAVGIPETAKSNQRLAILQAMAMFVLVVRIVRPVLRAGVCRRHHACHPLPKLYQHGHGENRAFPVEQQRVVNALSLLQFPYAAWISSAWMALASCLTRQGQQRSWRRMRQLLSWVFAPSPGARLAWARLAAFQDSGLSFPGTGSSRNCFPGGPCQPGRPGGRLPVRPGHPRSTRPSCRARLRPAPRTPVRCRGRDWR